MTNANDPTICHTQHATWPTPLAYVRICISAHQRPLRRSPPTPATRRALLGRRRVPAQRCPDQWGHGECAGAWAQPHAPANV